MSRLISGLVIAFIACSVQYTSGYKWITLSSNASIPKDAIRLNNRTYVGRAVHYNLVLPAEVYNSTFAVISYNSQQIVKTQFELLTATERCEWHRLSYTHQVSPNVVRGGSAWNYEPIYIAKTTYVTDNDTHIASILLESNRVIAWDLYWYRFALICEDNTSWMDTSSAYLPSNAVSGGIGNNGAEFFIARLLGNSSWIPGMLNPYVGTTVAESDNVRMESVYSQVLVGSKNQYKWYSTQQGVVPDYAVVGGQAESGELRYVVYVNNTSTYGVSSEMRQWPSYKVLVRNI